MALPKPQVINPGLYKGLVMMELSTLNAVLDVILKTMAIFIAGYIVFLMKNFQDFIQKAEKSVESVEQSAEAVEKSVRWGKLLPFIGGKE
jgi:hypothetical protein